MNMDSPIITDLYEAQTTDTKDNMINIKEAQTTKRSNSGKGIFLPNLITTTNRPSSKTMFPSDLEITESQTESIKTIMLADERGEEESKQLYDHIKSFSFFDMINNQYPGYRFVEPALISLCSKLKYEKHVVSKQLYKENESTNGKVYLVYSGEVCLYKKSVDEPSSPTKKDGSLANVYGVSSPDPRFSKGEINSFESSSPKRRTRLYSKPRTYGALIARSSLEDLDNPSKYGTLLKTYRAGDYFGEQALFTWEKRLFSAVTSGVCELLVLNRHDFHQIKGKYDEKRKKLYDFMENFVPKFSSKINYQLFEELVQLIEERVVERGTYLTVEGEPCDSIYMIYEGSCEFLKTVRLDETIVLKDPLISLKQLLRIGPVHTESIPICNVNRGTFVGDESVFREEGTYNFSTRMVSGIASVFVINKEAFVEKFPKIVQEELESLFKAKSKHYEETIKNTIAQKYPQMEILSIESSPSSKKINEEKFLAMPIILVPIKHRKQNQNTPARSGMFRNKTSITNITPIAITSYTKQTYGSQENLDDYSYSPKFKAREKLASQTTRVSQSRKRFSELADRVIDQSSELESSKNGRTKELENLKMRISRTYVNSDALFQGDDYLNSSPLKKPKNFNETTGENLLINPSNLLRDYGLNDSKEEYQQRNRLNSVTHRSTNKDKLEASPLFSKYEGNRNHNKALQEGRFKKFNRNKSIETARLKPIEDKTVDLEGSFMELRQLLLGKVATSKEFLMAKKRLSTKTQTNKMQVDVGRDVSLGKRLDVLFKLLHDRQKDPLPVLTSMRTTRARLRSESPLKSTTTRISIFNEPISPISPLKKRVEKQEHEELKIVVKPEKKVDLSERIKETIAKSKIDVDTLDQIDVNESIELMTGSIISTKTMRPDVIITDSAIKLKNEKRMALLRFKSGRSKDGSPKGQEPGTPQRNAEKVAKHGVKTRAKFQIMNTSNASTKWH